MKYKAFFCILLFVMLSGCAGQEDPAATREPRNLITRDNYDDLEIKPRKKEPVEVDYKKEGTYRQNFEMIEKSRE